MGPCQPSHSTWLFRISATTQLLHTQVFIVSKPARSPNSEVLRIRTWTYVLGPRQWPVRVLYRDRSQPLPMWRYRKPQEEFVKLQDLVRNGLPTIHAVFHSLARPTPLPSNTVAIMVPRNSRYPIHSARCHIVLPNPLSENWTLHCDRLLHFHWEAAVPSSSSMPRSNGTASVSWKPSAIVNRICGDIFNETRFLSWGATVIWQAFLWVSISAIFYPALLSRFKLFLPPRLYLYAARLAFVTAAAENWLSTAHPALKWLFAAAT